MGWETHGVCVESDGRQLGEVYRTITTKQKCWRTIFKDAQHFHILLHCQLQLPKCFVISLPHTSVRMLKLRLINPVLGNVVSAMCFD